jgi:hypothetical protein
LVVFDEKVWVVFALMRRWTSRYCRKKGNILNHELFHLLIWEHFITTQYNSLEYHYLGENNSKFKKKKTHAKEIRNSWHISSFLPECCKSNGAAKPGSKQKQQWNQPVANWAILQAMQHQLIQQLQQVS